MDRTRLGGGSGALAMAVMALAFVLLVPVCTAAENHAVSHDGPHAVCCVMVDEASMSAVQQVPDAKPAPAIAWHVAPRLSLVMAGLPAVRPPGASPSRSLAYHARSARNLS